MQQLKLRESWKNQPKITTKYQKESGDLGGNRTHDNLIKSQVLYRLSYQITRVCCCLAALICTIVRG
jgi:hypothetical protein